VLEGLSRDPSIRGTVIVAFQDAVLAGSSTGMETASRFESDYEQRVEHGHGHDYVAVEAVLTDLVRNRLRSYADGARPLTSLLTRTLAPTISPQYAIVLPDRSRLANYAIVDPRVVYYSRVIRDLGKDIAFDANTDYAQIDARLLAEIDALTPESSELLEERCAEIARAAAAIQARGGSVTFVVMPTGGLITELEERRYPRRLFWDRFAEMSPSMALHFADIPAMRELPVPDGSHLDYRSRARFTHALLDAMHVGSEHRVPH